MCDFTTRAVLTRHKTGMPKKIITIALLMLSVTSAIAAPRERTKEEYWWLCPVDRSLPARPQFSTDALALGSIEVRADKARVIDGETTEFTEAELIDDNTALTSINLSYDQITESGVAEGDVHLWTSSMLWRGERSLFNLGDRQTRLTEGRYWLTDRNGRGHAHVIRHDGYADVSRLERVDYTTCPKNNESWRFSASKIKLDHNTDRGYATNTLIRVKGVPVFYLPYLSFPLSDKRKSGVLAPIAGSTSQAGFDLQVPVYLNLAPQQDATLTPRVIADRGEMLGGEYRYMGRNFRSEIDFTYMPSDDLEGGIERSSVSVTHQQTYAEGRGFANALIQNVSDARYLEDFGGSLSATSQRFLDRRIETTYTGNRFSVYGLMQGYQSVDDSFNSEASGPYKRLPQVVAQTLFSEQHLTPHFHALSSVTYFDRQGSVSGTRVTMEPTLALPFIKPWAYVRPAIGVRYMGYGLTDTQTFEDRLDTAVPVASLDGQLFFERRLSFLNRGILQTLEPRALYVLAPNVNQDDLPVFDTGYFDFSFLNMFRQNRFSGGDRYGDANQLALALTSRTFSLDSGLELLKVSLGQIFYFRDREVTLPPLSDDFINNIGLADAQFLYPGYFENNSSTSEMLGEVATHFTEDLSARVTLQWDPDASRTSKSAVSMRYAPEDGTVVNLAYRQRQALTDVEQTDISFRLPLTENLSMVGRWAYSLQSQQALEVVGGIEYESCCWGIRLLSRRYIRNVEGEFDNAIFMQAELKGLAGVGRTASSFLRRSIPGYEPFF